MSVMANYWVDNGVDITLLTLNDISEKPFYELDPRIQYHPLGLARASANPLEGIVNNIKRIFVLRKEIRKAKPDVIISFMDQTNVLTLFAGVGLGIPIIVSEHVDPNMVNIGAFWDNLRAFFYPSAKIVVLLNEKMKTYFSHKVLRKTIIIPNPVLAPPKEKLTHPVDPLARPCIMAMGRFSHEKGFDILLEAFARIKDRYPAWSITILGDGALREDLESLRGELGLDGKAHMPGLVKNPTNYLRQADIFLLSSRNEAFPMALCEAMACGAPVISFDCNSGPRDIITNGVDGILVPPDDEGALADAMDRLMGDEAERERLKTEAPKIVERFALEKVMAMWDDVINKVIDNK